MPNQKFDDNRPTVTLIKSQMGHVFGGFTKVSWTSPTGVIRKKDSDAFLARMGYVRDGGQYRIEKPNTKRIAMFCHGGFGSAWVASMLEIPLPLMWAGFVMHTTSVTCILFDERKPGIATPRCLYYGAMPHLYHDGIEPSQAGIKANYE